MQQPGSGGVTLLPEVCTGALCAHCKEHNGGDLLKCGRCKRAWYCSREHQQADYAQHKAVCRVVAPLVQALIESATDVKPTSYEAAQRLVAAATLYAQRCAPPAQLPSIFSCLSNTVFCRVCFKLREQLPAGSKLVCCPDCLWGWCCQEHWEQFKPQHAPFCAQYATFRRLNVRARQQARAGLLSGSNQLRYPMGKVVSQEQTQQLLAEGWGSYRRLRLPSVSDDDTFRMMTDDLAIPLTALWAAQQLYSSEQLADLQEFTLHLVGAANFEFQHVVANTAIEELLHLLPPGVKSLHVVLVGPEWRVISPGPSCSTFDKDVCPPCTQGGCKRTLTIYRGTYEDFARSKSWSRPTLALACNSGVGCVEEESWAKAVKVLLDKSLPCCFTSMTQAEADLDAAALRAAGAAVSHSGPNTFGSTIPLRDFDSGPDVFYSTNGFAMLFKGRRQAQGAKEGGDA